MNNQPERVIPEVDRKKTVKISRKEELVILWIELYGWYIKRLNAVFAGKEAVYFPVQSGWNNLREGTVLKTENHPPHHLLRSEGYGCH